MAESADAAGDRPCLLCGTLENPTVEHIVPQALWRRFEIDPDRDDLAVYTTTLCLRHQRATSALHDRPEMMDLIELGEPVSRRTLRQLGDWALWVTLLLSLARGSGVLGPDVSRELLMRRFDANDGSGAGGVRVYAARVTEYVEPADPPAPSYSLALVRDSSVVLDHRRRPSGFDVGVGPINASEAIGLGRLALLVVTRSHESGPGHNDRLDQAAASVGLELIYPLRDRPHPLPTLEPRPVSMHDVSRLFAAMPFGEDLSLMPPAIAELWAGTGGAGDES